MICDIVILQFCGSKNFYKSAKVQIVEEPKKNSAPTGEIQNEATESPVIHSIESFELTNGKQDKVEN